MRVWPASRATVVGCGRVPSVAQPHIEDWEVEWGTLNVALVLPVGHRGEFLRAHADGSLAPVFNERERSLGLVEVAGIRTKLFADGDAVDAHCRVICLRATKDLWSNLRHAGRLNLDPAVTSTCG